MKLCNTHSRCPSALARAQWAAVRITRRAIIEPAHGYAKAPVFTSAIGKNQKHS